MPNVMPNFFIVGAAKAGTTALYEYLKQHPQVYMPPLKEPQYFSQLETRYGAQNYVNVVWRHGTGFLHLRTIADRRNPGVAWVGDEASYLKLFEGADGFRAVGEASTSYLGFEDTAERIYEQVPEARIIILLRDPIERSYSHYLMDVQGGRQALSFYDAIIKEYQDPDFGWGKNWHRYIMLYYPGVKRYLDVFGGEQVLVLLTEDLQVDPRSLVMKVSEFLDLDTAPVATIDFTTKHNAYRVPRNRLVQMVLGSSGIRSIGRKFTPRLGLRTVRDKVFFKQQEKPAQDAQAVDILREVYASDIAKLETLLGRSLPELRRSWGEVSS
jgi:hypothetical protein